MSRIITFSRTFPAYHPKAGQPTYFVEKVWKSLWDMDQFYGVAEFENRYNEVFPITFDPLENIHNHVAKNHTIRKGNRFKKGDYFSPAVWGNNINVKSGKIGPYQSNQVKIAPDIKVVNTWEFELVDGKVSLNGLYHCNISDFGKMLEFGRNDGLGVDDLLHWFKYPKPVRDHQIICWNDNIGY